MEEPGSGAGGDGAPASVVAEAVDDCAPASEPLSLDEELGHITELIPSSELVSCFPSSVSIRMLRSIVKTLTLRIQFTSDYPAEPLILELKSKTLPDGLVSKLQKGCDKELKDNLAGNYHIFDTYKFVEKLLEGNRLIPCFQEIGPVKSLLTASDKMKANEKTGAVTIQAHHNKYSIHFELTVPPDYPAGEITYAFKSSNFHPKLVQKCGFAVDEIIRVAQGATSLKIKRQGKGGKEKKAEGGQAAKDSLPTAVTDKLVHEFRHDQRWLKQASEIDSSTTAGRKQRKQFNRLEGKWDDKRAAADLALQASLEEGEASKNIEPCLMPVMEHVLNDFLRALPEACCQLCCKTVMPADPARQEKAFSSAKDNPERVYCGHWYHYSCLETFMMKPPFDKKFCSACGEKVYSSKFSTDYAKLEQQWAKEQANQREIDDINDMFG